jgi:hypothetical protein
MEGRLSAEAFEGVETWMILLFAARRGESNPSRSGDLTQPGAQFPRFSQNCENKPGSNSLRTGKITANFLNSHWMLVWMLVGSFQRRSV